MQAERLGPMHRATNCREISDGEGVAKGVEEGSASSRLMTEQDGPMIEGS